MAYKINEDLYIGNTNKQLKDLPVPDGDTLPINGYIPFDGTTIPDGYEELFNMSGSNENGNWIKFPDGTMICWGTKKYGSISFSNSWGSLYDTPKFNLGNFPQSFAEVPTVTLQSCYGATCWPESINPTRSSIGETWLMRPTSGAYDNIHLFYIAIGRWK